MEKKYHSGLRHVVRDLNKNIEKDDLWNGRFVFHIMDTHFNKFEDGSGGVLHAVIRGYDKADGYYKDYRFDYAIWSILYHFDIWKIGNRFITEDANAWKNGHNPYKEKKDFNKIKVNDDVWNFKLYPHKPF